MAPAAGTTGGRSLASGREVLYRNIHAESTKSKWFLI